MTVQITYVSNDSNNGYTFPEIMVGRIAALHITIPQHKNNYSFHLLRYRQWSADEIRAHFYNVEYQCNQQIYLNKHGLLDTEYTNNDSYFYLEFLYLVAQYTSHEELYNRIAGNQFGIFTWAEPTEGHGPQGSGGVSTSRVNYTWHTRPKIEGKVVRRMYQGADYVCAGRALSVGLIEKKPRKRVIWLTTQEHKQVVNYVRGKRK